MVAETLLNNNFDTGALIAYNAAARTAKPIA